LSIKTDPQKVTLKQLLAAIPPEQLLVFTHFLLQYARRALVQ
jgi:hypothetical protein